MLNNQKNQKKTRMPVAFEPLAHLQKRLLKKVSCLWNQTKQIEQ